MTEICGDGPWPPGKLQATGSASYCKLPAGHEDHVDGNVRWPWRQYDPLHELQAKVDRLQKRLEQAWVFGDEQGTQHVIAHMRLIKIRQALAKIVDDVAGAYASAEKLTDVTSRELAMNSLVAATLLLLRETLGRHSDPAE